MDGFMPEQETEPVGGFMLEWDMLQLAAEEIGMAGNIFQPDNRDVSGEDNAPMKIYEPKHRRTESRQFFSGPQKTEKAGNGWMIYG